jgi:hypothetical protein
MATQPQLWASRCRWYSSMMARSTGMMAEPYRRRLLSGQRNIGIDHVAPGSASADVVDGRPVDSDPLSELGGIARCRADQSDQVVGELRIAVSLARRRDDRPTLDEGIFQILPLGAGEKMLRVAARWVIAGVADVQIASIHAVMEPVDAMPSR